LGTADLDDLQRAVYPRGTHTHTHTLRQ